MVDSITAEGGAAVCIETDVTDRASVAGCVAATIERFGSLQVMVHNAFTSNGRHRLENCDLDRYWIVYEPNRGVGEPVLRPGGLCRAGAAAGHGRLILITSPSGVEGRAQHAAVLARQGRPAGTGQEPGV